ncbi:cysteine dioxygenase family protein [Dyella jejuensis]|uniref:Cysteine dioxygenase family protein n=1 Tax=Dyella jejuensis TaxID=1432009 RepID=A0ABW8JL01_9GAMM
MHDALKPASSNWTRRLLATIDACVGAQGTIDVPRLAEALATVSAWDECPHADEVAGHGTAATYRRIPLAVRADLGYEALLIVWPPGYATPVHDHDDLWGMEFVLDGVLEVEAFDLASGAQPQLVSREVSVLGIGDYVAFTHAGYAHRCRNLSSNRPTLSLHVYGGELNSYRSFRQDEDRWIATTHPTIRDCALS